MTWRYTGIFYALLASLTFTSTGFLIKQLRVDFFDALLCRFLLQTSILGTYILYKRNPFVNGSRQLILLQTIRTIVGTGGFFLFFLSYRYIPLPDLTTCRYTQVIWTAILTKIIFHERISMATAVAIIFTLTGVILVAQPTFLFDTHRLSTNASRIIVNRTADIEFESDKSYRSLGLCLALACAVAISLSTTLNKKLLVSNIPQSTIMFDFSLLTFSILILYHLYKRFVLHLYETKPMLTREFYLAGSVSLLQTFSAIIAQRALKIEHLSIFTVVRSSEILFAIILQTLFSRVKPNGFVLFGAFLVTTSIVLVAVEKFRQDRQISPEITSQKADS